MDARRPEARRAARDQPAGSSRWCGAQADPRAPPGARELLTAESATVEATTEIDALREHLAAGSTAYAARYAPINRVRKKRQLAETAAAQDPTIVGNVAALRANVPADVGMDDVEARLGAAWIDTDAHRAFPDGERVLNG